MTSTLARMQGPIFSARAPRHYAPGTSYGGVGPCGLGDCRCCRHSPGSTGGSAQGAFLGCPVRRRGKNAMASGMQRKNTCPGRKLNGACFVAAQATDTAALVGTEGVQASQVRRVDIYDTTLRDGSQMVGISLSVLDKLRITDLLVDLGVSYIEAGWPGSNPKDAEYFSKCGMNTKRNQTANEPSEGAPSTNASEGAPSSEAETGARIAAFGATRYKGTTCEKDGNVQALVASSAPVVTLVAKAWDAQVERVLEASLQENLDMISDTVHYFKALGREVMVDAEHFFDGFQANPGYAMECVEAAADAGADVVVLCDTNGGSMPWQVNDATRQVVLALRSRHPHVRVGVHCHNDCELAVANSVAAVEGGASLVQGCVNGYGERTGNANILSVIGILQVKLGHSCVPRSRLSRMTEIAQAVAEIAGQPMPASQPFVGSNAFAHKGGIHVAALRKMPESYNHCDPSLVGNAMRSVVSDLSGRGNILEKAEKAGLVLDKEVAGKVLARIKQMESEGCAFESASASVDMLIVRRGSSYVQPFQVLEFSCISSNRGGVPHVYRNNADGSSNRSADVAVHAGEEGVDWVEGGLVNSQAIVKIRIEGCDRMSAAEGNGPVDALSHALRGALEPQFPQLKNVELVDYRVRLVEPSGSGCGTRSTTRVTIDFCDRQGSVWTTVGAHTSIVEASFRALVDGLEFGIANCSEAGCTISRA